MKRDARKGSILALRQIEPQAPLVVVTLVVVVVMVFVCVWGGRGIVHLLKARRKEVSWL